MGQAQSKLKLQTTKVSNKLLDRARSRPPSLQGRSASLSNLVEQTTSPGPRENLSPVASATTPAVQSSLAHESVPVVASTPTPATDDTPAETATSTPVIVLEPGDSPPLSVVFATTDSAIKDLAGRRGFDVLPALKVALTAIVDLTERWDGSGEAVPEFNALQNRLKALNAIPNIPTADDSNNFDHVQRHLHVISEMIQRVWQAINSTAGQEPRGQPVLLVHDIENVKSLLAGLASLLEVFEVDGSVAVNDRLVIVRQRLSSQGHVIDQPSSLNILNQNGNVTYNLGRDVVNNNNVYNYISAYEIARHDPKLEMQKAMETIKKVFGENFVSEAADDEQPTGAGCMSGTRQGILAQLVTWVREDPMAIFWLAGMAGTGKTSIAVSLCRLLRKDPNVLFGGGFFCSRSAGGISRSDVRRILPTLATLLAGESVEFAEALASELNKDQRIGHKPVADQIGPLLRTPLAALASSSRPVVFVVDALDECGDEKELAALLRILADLKCEAKVKFIFTSRPEMHIRGTPISSPENNTVLHLHTIKTAEVTSDIRLYFHHRLKDAAPAATWYTNDDVELLVKQSNGLFIFASTVLDYILSREEDEDRRDRLVMVTSAVLNRTAARAALDEVYGLVLAHATTSRTVDSNELERLRSVLACVLTARAPLSVDSLAALVNVTSRRLRGSLERLHSLVYLPMEDTQPGIRTLHASFGDYLFERAPQHIQIATTLGHDILARGCFRIMAGNDLHFNVSRSRSSFEPNSETVPDWITFHLIYACLHWAHHIDSSSERSAFDEDIRRDFRPKFLFWLEVLSIMRKIGMASGLLRIAHSAVKQDDVARFLRDANAFVASSYTAISESAPHIYISALQFTAEDSLVYCDFMPLCMGVISIESLSPKHSSGRLLMTLTGHEDELSSVEYSPDGCLLASGSLDGTVRIWDTRTGEEIMSPLQEDGRGFFSVVFSPNGHHVASGTGGGTVHVWSVATGLPALPPLRGHSDIVRSVRFSPDGALIASASADMTVLLSSFETGQEVSVMKGHTDQVKAVAFSPNGRLLASASKDMTVRLWSLTGEAIGTAFASLQGDIGSLAFSPDDNCLAAGSIDTSEVHVWDLKTPDAIPVVIGNQASVFSLAYSPDGSKLASSSYTTVRFWDPSSGQELFGTSLVGHSDWIQSVSFSSDGLFLASGSRDRTVKIWEVVTGHEPTVQPQTTHAGSVFSAVVSADGTFIASGSGDHTVRVWDASTGEAMSDPLAGHRDSVYQVAISPNSRVIASASADDTVRIWDAETGKAVGEPLLGHKGDVTSLAFSQDGRWLASGSLDTTVRMWDVATVIATAFDVLHCAQIIWEVSFSPDGRTLAAGDGKGYLYFWHSGTSHSARAAISTGGSSIYSIAFSPDSTHIVSGVEDSVVRVWNVHSGCSVLELRGHADWVDSVSYSPESQYIVSASRDKTARLWDASNGNCIAVLRGHGDFIASVAFTLDGMSLVSSGHDKTIRIWNVEQAISSPTPDQEDPLAIFTPAAIDDNGWLVGSSGELLLWLPLEYRGCIQLSPCSMIIRPHRISFLTDDLDNGPPWGDKWTTCWSGGT